MSGKDATLESIRVAVRKLEKAVLPIEGLSVRLVGLERKFGALDAKVAGLFANGLVARARAVGILEQEPEPEPEQTPPVALSGEDIAATIKASVAEIGLQLGETLRDALAGLLPPAPARPKNGAAHPMVSDDLGIDGRSVVAFEQPKG